MQEGAFFLNITYLLISKKFFFVYGGSNHKMLQVMELGNSACPEAVVSIAAMRAAKRSCTQSAGR